MVKCVKGKHRSVTTRKERESVCVNGCGCVCVGMGEGVCENALMRDRK